MLFCHALLLDPPKKKYVEDIPVTTLYVGTCTGTLNSGRFRSGRTFQELLKLKSASEGETSTKTEFGLPH